MNNSSKKPNLKISMILFMYNEEKAIKSVVEELINVFKKAKLTHQIILVEGGSNDNTFKIIQKLEKLYPQCVALKNGKMLGDKIIKGFTKVKGEYVGIMYSDGQVDPYVIPDFLKILDQGKTDIIKGTRRSRKGLIRQLFSSFFNLISQLLFSLHSRDINGHPKIFSSKMIPRLNLQDKDVTIDLEIFLKAQLLKLKITEILVNERKRAGGSSSVRIFTALRTLKHILAYKWGNKKALLDQIK